MIDDKIFARYYKAFRLQGSWFTIMGIVIITLVIGIVYCRNEILIKICEKYRKDVTIEHISDNKPELIENTIEHISDKKPGLIENYLRNYMQRLDKIADCKTPSALNLLCYILSIELILCLSIDTAFRREIQRLEDEDRKEELESKDF